MRLTLAQINPTVGDVAGNAAAILDAVERARRDGADLVVTPELSLIGYPPRDLLFRKGVVEACERAVEELARRSAGTVLVVGHPRRVRGAVRPFANSASICSGGRVMRVCDKRLLPGYDVFDEDRYFEPGSGPCVVEVAGRRLGLLICEDFWRARDTTTGRSYPQDPIKDVVDLGCNLLLVLNASPFVLGKWQRHVDELRAVAVRHRIPIVAVQQVGANDELIFDGRSIAVDSSGSPLAVLPGFAPAAQTVMIPEPGRTAGPGLPADVALQVDLHSELFQALVLGIGDYVRKSGFGRVVIGLSGGIDSSVTACLAAAALGPENVVGVMMPSRYSTSHSLEDARELAGNLGLARTETVSIESLHQGIHDALGPALGEIGGVTDENVQARARGILLMAFANSIDALVLVASNKSELATGYSTIYGDMCGALGVLGDVVKTRVYELAAWINVHPGEGGFAGPPIPQRCISKMPSAELRPNQFDQDTLPPYDVLDQVVEAWVERELSVGQIIEETDLEPALVRQTAQMIDRAQYKRDQAAPLLKVTARAFGRGRPMPIAMRWDEAARLTQVSSDKAAERREP